MGGLLAGLRYSPKLLDKKRLKRFFTTPARRLSLGEVGVINDSVMG